MANNAGQQQEASMLNTLNKIRKSISGINYQTGSALTPTEHYIACNKAVIQLRKISKEDRDGIFLLDKEEKALKEKCWSIHGEVAKRIQELTAESKIPNDFYSEGSLHEAHQEDYMLAKVLIASMTESKDSKAKVSKFITNLGREERANSETGVMQWVDVMCRTHPVKQELRDLYYAQVNRVTSQVVLDLEEVIGRAEANPITIKQAVLKLELMKSVFLGAGLSAYLAKQTEPKA